MRLATLTTIAFTLSVAGFFPLAQEVPYAQTNSVTAEENLTAKMLSQVKRMVTSSNLEVAVWKIEKDEKKSVDVKRLSTKLNFALMDAGLLAERAFDFTDIDDRNELRRVAEIYGIGTFVYGKRTVVEGETIKVSFQILDASSLALIWEGLISSEKPLPAELALTLYYGKWVSLGASAGAGVGSITTLALGLNVYYNEIPKARSNPEIARLYGEFVAYQSWSLGLGIASVVSGGLSSYLFLTDQEEVYLQRKVSTGPPGKDISVFIWPKPGGVMVSGYIRF